MQYYKDYYDVVIIGGALAGLSSAMVLAKEGKDVLVLEQHNLPGGLATSFVRNEFEIEATLHEMMSIGPEEQPLKIRQFFNDMGVDIDWIRVPEAYRIILPNSNIDVTLPAGYEEMADTIDKRVPGQKEEVLKLMDLCDKVYKSVGALSKLEKPLSKMQMLKQHEELVKTAGYTAEEVLATFNLKPETIEILSPYWIYVGNPLSSLPFTVYAVLMADYFTGGSYICKKNSHEMSLRMATKAEEYGAHIEYRQKVDKILVKNGKVTGVRTARGDEINCGYVISGAYPNRVYASMIEPEHEIPNKAVQYTNGKKIGVTSFSVMMILEGTPEEVGIDSYSIFSGSTMDTDVIWKQYHKLEPYDYITSICINKTIPHKHVVDGKEYTELSITALPLADGWMNVKPEEYNDVKRRIAKGMIQEFEKTTGADVLSRIVEIEIATPMTIARYAGSWNGGVYGYRHCQDDNIVARLAMDGEENFIDGLYFANACSVSGNGMGPAITNGRKAAKDVMDDEKKKGGETA